METRIIRACTSVNSFYMRNFLSISPKFILERFSLTEYRLGILGITKSKSFQPLSREVVLNIIIINHWKCVSLYNRYIVTMGNFQPSKKSFINETSFNFKTRYLKYKVTIVVQNYRKSCFTEYTRLT